MDSTLKTMIDNLQEKTGKPLEEWLSILAGKQFSKHGEAVNHLKQEYGLTHGYANTIVHLSKDEQSEDELLKEQFSGKEILKPIYEQLVTVINELGKDVEFIPKKAYVSVKRKKQFAILQPSTKTRFDLGLNLKGTPPSGKLEASGSFNAMCSHRIRLESQKDINLEVKHWLTEAYVQAG